jgi:hypothetical protein
VTGKSVPDPGFAGDDGRPDARLIDAFGTGTVSAVQAALVEARVFAPLVALLGESDVGADGLRRDKTSDIAVVTVQRPDGARALPVFSSLERLAAWDASARPLPVEGPRAALAAYAEDAVALLVDPGSDASCVLFGPLLLALAEGRVWVPPFLDPEVRQAVADHVPADVGWQLTESPDADVTLVLTYVGATAESAAAAARELAAVLADVPLLRARLTGGLDLVVQLG